MFGKKCFYCRQKIPSNGGVRKSVRIYGKVGTFKKDFCCDEHQDSFEERTEILFKNKRPCIPCGLR